MMNDIVNDPAWQRNQPPLFLAALPVSSGLLSNETGVCNSVIPATVISVQQTDGDTVIFSRDNRN